MREVNPDLIESLLPSTMSSSLQQSRHAPKPVAPKPQPAAGKGNVDDAENLQSFLTRLKFGIGSFDLTTNPRSPSVSAPGQPTIDQQNVAPLSLGEMTNGRRSVTPLSEAARRESFKEAVFQAAAVAQNQSSVEGKLPFTLWNARTPLSALSLTKIQAYGHDRNGYDTSRPDTCISRTSVSPAYSCEYRRPIYQ